MTNTTPTGHSQRPGSDATHDAIIIGGGAAGLAAALWLGRAQRSALLLESGVYRNAPATEIHSFPTRDGTPPAEYRRQSHLDLHNYPTITTRQATVSAVTPRFTPDHAPEQFLVELSDGEVVVFHDATVERTTNGIGAIADLTLVEVRALDAGSYVSPTFAHERIPTLEEVLDLVHGSGVKLLLDVKQSQVLDKKRVVRLIERYDLLSDVMVGVRSVSDLSGFRALNPNLRTLGFVPDVDSIESFVRAGVDIVRLWPDWIRKSRANLTCRYQYLRRLLARGARTADIGSASCLVHRVQSMDKPVWVTAGNASGEALTELVRLRVNGILTDLPEVLTDLLAGRKGQRSSTKASSK